MRDANHLKQISAHVPPTAQAEPLEPRRLLAGIEAGVLVARGTDGNDTIALQRSGPDNVLVTTNGVGQVFDMDDFTGVRLEGFGGNDRFQMNDPLVSPVVRNTTVMGGAGWDAIDYSARVEDLKFSGYEEPDSRTPFQFVRVTSGLQEDRIDSGVEHFAGGSGDDDFSLDGHWLDEEAPREVSMEGFGGNDHFSHPAGLTTTMYGGAGNDFFEEDDFEAGFNAVYAGDGDDVISFNNEGRSSVLDAGTGIDTITLWGSTREVIDLRPYLGLENVEGAGNTTVIGNDLDNRILASNNDRPVTLFGNGGNDTLVGGGSADQLDGGAGNDSLAGAFGDDTLDGGAGFDTADAGPGNNSYANVELTPAAPRIRIFDRVLIAEGSWGTDLIEVEYSSDNAVTARVNNAAASFNTADFDRIELRGNNGFDRLRVVDPVPTLRPFVRPLTLLGGHGNDSIDGSNGNDVILGGDGEDAVDGHHGDDSIVGAFGSDTLDGGTGHDTVDGGPGNDFVSNAEVTPPPPRISLDGRILTADGSWGVDLLTIERVAGGDDVIVRVTDTVRRFDLDDLDGVLLRGQAGFDYLQVLQPIPGLQVTLHGNDGNDTLVGSAGREVMYGGNGNDVLLAAQGGRDHLDGGWNDDFIDARDGDGDDSVFGNGHVDTARVDPGDAVRGVERFA